MEWNENIGRDGGGIGGLWKDDGKYTSAQRTLGSKNSSYFIPLLLRVPPSLIALPPITFIPHLFPSLISSSYSSSSSFHLHPLGDLSTRKATEDSKKPPSSTVDRHACIIGLRPYKHLYTFTPDPSDKDAIFWFCCLNCVLVLFYSLWTFFSKERAMRGLHFVFTLCFYFFITEVCVLFSPSFVFVCGLLTNWGMCEPSNFSFIFKYIWPKVGLIGQLELTW